MIRDIEEAKKEAVKAREEMDRVVRQHDQAIHKVTAQFEEERNSLIENFKSTEKENNRLVSDLDTLKRQLQALENENDFMF